MNVLPHYKIPTANKICMDRRAVDNLIYEVLVICNLWNCTEYMISFWVIIYGFIKKFNNYTSLWKYQDININITSFIVSKNRCLLYWNWGQVSIKILINERVHWNIIWIGIWNGLIINLNTTYEMNLSKILLFQSNWDIFTFQIFMYYLLHWNNICLILLKFMVININIISYLKSINNFRL